jgi:hypothetical protein
VDKIISIRTSVLCGGRDGATVGGSLLALAGFWIGLLCGARVISASTGETVGTDETVGAVVNEVGFGETVGRRDGPELGFVDGDWVGLDDTGGFVGFRVGIPDVGGLVGLMVAGRNVGVRVGATTGRVAGANDVVGLDPGVGVICCVGV